MSSALHARTPTLTAHDPRGVPLRAVQWWRSEPDLAPEARITQTLYDTTGRAVAHRDARLFATSATRPSIAMIHSLSGNTLHSDSVDAGWHATLFTEDGVPTRRYDSRGTLTRFDHDDLRRPTAVYETAEGEPERCSERFIYGDAQADPAFNLRQQPLRHDDTAGTRHMLAYAINGLRLEERQQFLHSLEAPDWPDSTSERDTLLETNEGSSTGWTFSPWGEQLEMLDAGGNRQRQQLGIDGRLRGASVLPAGAQSAKTLVSDIHYNAFGQVVSQTNGDALTSEYTYDPADGRLTRLLCSSSTKNLQDLSYRYDPVGNVTRHEDRSLDSRYHRNQRIDPVAEFRYDSLYQLIEATGRERIGAGLGPALPSLIDFASQDDTLIGTYTRQYQYDAGGNLLLMQHHGQNGQDHAQRMAVSSTSNKSIPWREGLTDTQIEASFDANGNLGQLRPGQDLTWDVRNQLAEVVTVDRAQNPNDAERYVYGGGGKRLRKYATRQASGITHHSETRYLPGIELHEDTATGRRWQVVNMDAGRASARFTHWFDEPPEGMRNDAIVFGMSEVLGSVTLEVDEQGQLVSREEYYPFGGTALLAARSEIEVSYKTIRYSGKERDATGLYYYGYRYLAPWLGRWLNPDPAGVIDGLNVFLLTGNNPITRVDLDGRVTDDELLKIIADAEAKYQRELSEWFNNLVENLGTATQQDLQQSAPELNQQPVHAIANDELAGPPRARTPQPGTSRVRPDEIPVGTVALSEQMKSQETSEKVQPSGESITDNTKEKPHKCNVCGGRFKYPSDLKSHMRKHAPERPFICDICQKTFKRPNNLTEHKRVHQNKPFPFKCEHCTAKFQKKGSLIKHTNTTHLDISALTCPTCGKIFKDISNLTVHVTLHSEIREFKCQKCPSTFKLKKHLNTHIKWKHP